MKPWATKFMRIIVALFSLRGIDAGASELWLQPWTPCVSCGWLGDYDIEKIFNSDASWATVIPHLNVLVFTPFHVGLLDEVGLSEAGDWLTRHHVAVDVDIQAMPFDKSCGQGIEGFGDPRAAEALVDRLKRAGISPRYITMDEPLWGGHYLQSKTACRYNIETLADKVVSMLSIYKDAFPQAEIGDTEPYAALSAVPGWRDGLKEFVDDVRGRSNVTIRFMNADSGWSESWMASLPSFIKQVKEMGLETGVIYDARAKSASGEEAVSQIVSEYRQLEDMLGVSVDKAVFGGWYRYPDHLLPEGDPSALVNALTGYILPKPTASLHVGTHCLDGTVTMHGDPLRGAGVSLQRLQGLAPEMLYTSTIDGKVPAWATRALFGVRINDESSPEEWADLKLTLGAFRYKEKSPFAKSVVQVAASELAKWQKWRSREGLFSLEQDSRSGRVSITIQQDASYSFNGPFFDVDPGAHYEASLMESLQPRAVGAAYAIVVFLVRTLPSHKDRPSDSDINTRRMPEPLQMTLDSLSFCTLMADMDPTTNCSLKEVRQIVGVVLHLGRALTSSKTIPTVRLGARASEVPRACRQLSEMTFAAR